MNGVRVSTASATWLVVSSFSTTPFADNTKIVRWKTDHDVAHAHAVGSYVPTA